MSAGNAVGRPEMERRKAAGVRDPYPPPAPAPSSNAIWAGLLSLQVTQVSLVALMLVIAGIVLFMPGGAAGDPATEYVLSKSPPGPRALAQGSAFPMVLTVAYTLTLLASLAAAITICVTRLDTSRLHRVTEGPALSRAVWLTAWTVFLVAPFLLEIGPSEGQLGFYFFSAVRQSRLLLVVFCESAFVAFGFAAVWVVLELTNIVNSLVREKRN